MDITRFRTIKLSDDTLSQRLIVRNFRFEHTHCIHRVSGQDVAFNAPDLTISDKGKSAKKDGSTSDIMPVPVQQLKLDNNCAPILTCAGMMLQCYASLRDTRVAVKYANYVHSKSMKKLQQTQYDLLENEAKILK